MKKVHLHMLAAGLVCICLHAAKAQFIGPYLLPPAPVLNSLIITDIDNNPAPEFLIGRADPVVSVGWYANNGIGQFDSLQALTADPEGYDQVITGDLDQDNDEDLILRKGNLILWRANDGAWNFGDTMEIGSASLLYQAIDLTGDGYPEITATDGSNPFWFRNDGLGTLGQKAYFDIIANDFKPFFADLNNDGDPDLIRLDEGNGGIFWYKNYGDGVFGAKTFIGSSLYSEEISLLDMDGDGDLDILAANPGGVRWLANLGGGVFNSSSQIIESIPFFIPMAVAADFDRDGDNDVFAAALSDPVLNEPERGHFRYYENLGNGLFAAPDSFGMAAGVQKLLVDDLDDDGDLDVAFRTDSAVGWWENLFNPIMIGGACFWDKNENKVWDAGEPSANGIRLQLEPTNLVTYTQSGDGFRFFVDTGDYLLSYAQNACWQLTTDSAEFHVSTSALPQTGYLFGFTRTNGSRYVRPVISGLHAQCDSKVLFKITLDNRSCNESAGKIALVLDGLVTYQAYGTPPSEINGDTLWWTFDSIAPFGNDQIIVLLQIPGAANIGDTIHLKAFTWLDEPDGSFTFSGSFLYQDIILCSYDPNDKMVDRASVPHDYDPLENELVYTIRFQNTGNDTATIVRLRDTLDTRLDWTSLRPLGSSHQYEVSLNSQTGLLQFTFNNILLPDSATNASGSQGFVQYAIQLQAGLLPGTVVHNRAGIYFDANSPVMTNTAETLVSLQSATHAPARAPWMAVQPNPASGLCTIQFERPAGKDAMLKLTDTQGRVLRNWVVAPGVLEQQIDLENLPAGMYFLGLEQTGRPLVITRLAKQ